MPILFLHIGMHKTATTTLQEICARSRARLLERGLLYPKLHLGVPFKRYSINHRLMSERWQAVAGSSEYEGSRSYWQDTIAPQLAAEPDANVLLSSEGLWNFTPGPGSRNGIARMRACFDGYHCRVIVYLRRQDRWLEAMHNQVVKNSAETRTLRAYVADSLRDGRADFFYKLEMWREFFGAQNVSVRIFEPEQLEEGDIVCDFFSQLGIEHSGLARVRPRNPQLDPGLMALKMTLNPYLRRRSHRRIAKHAFSWMQRLVPGRRQRTMPYELALQIMEHFAKSNQRVAREILDRADGRLFFALPGEEPPWEHLEPRPMLGRAGSR